MITQMLLDTSSLVYRAFFALPTSIRDDEGAAVNAVHGYLDMTSRLREDHAPASLVHCLDDDWRPAPRVAAYEGYKSTRADDPPELPWQFELLDRVLVAAGERIVDAPGWEADDAIGVIAAGAGDDERVAIVTGDRDLIQLVRDPVVQVLFTRRGVSDLQRFDEAAVADVYGVPADRYVDFAILRGDPSDGLPGVRGVGEKTARDLVGRFDSIEALQRSTAALTPKLAERVADAAAYLDAMQRVVPVQHDVELRVRQAARDDGALDALARAHRLTGPVDRLRAATA